MSKVSDALKTGTLSLTPESMGVLSEVIRASGVDGAERLSGDMDRTIKVWLQRIEDERVRAETPWLRRHWR